MVWISVNLVLWTSKSASFVLNKMHSKQNCRRSGNGHKTAVQGQGCYFESGKIDSLKKSQGNSKQFNKFDLIPLKAGGNIRRHYHLNDVFP